MSLASSILAGFRPTTTTFRRGSAPTIVDGRAVPGAVVNVQVLAAILPARARRLAREVEGERLTGLVKIYASDPLYAGRDTGEPADRVDWNGDTYEVEEVDYFTDGGLYVATARKARV